MSVNWNVEFRLGTNLVREVWWDKLFKPEKPVKSAVMPLAQNGVGQMHDELVQEFE